MQQPLHYVQHQSVRDREREWKCHLSVLTCLHHHDHCCCRKLSYRTERPVDISWTISFSACIMSRQRMYCHQKCKGARAMSFQISGRISENCGLSWMRIALTSLVICGATIAYAEDFAYSGDHGPGFWAETADWKAC